MEQVTVTVPMIYAERMKALAEASGVTLDALVSASLEMRCEQHEGKATLDQELVARASRYLAT